MPEKEAKAVSEQRLCMTWPNSWKKVVTWGGREGGGAGEEREREGRRERGRGCGAWGRPVVTRALGEVEMNAVKESYSLQPSVSVSQDAKPILIDTATSMYV